MLVTLAFPRYFRLLKEHIMSLLSSFSLPFFTTSSSTYLIHRVRILQIEVFHDIGYLTFKPQFVAFLEVKARCVDNGQQDAIISRLKDLNRSGVDSVSALPTVAEELVHRSTLLRSCCGRDVRRVNKKTKQRALTKPQHKFFFFVSAHLYHKQMKKKEKIKNKKHTFPVPCAPATIRLKVGAAFLR